MITPGSRYSTGTVARLTGPDGVLRSTIIPAAPTAKQFRYTLYQIRDGDEISFLSYQQLGDSAKWWQIADANPEILLWTDLPVGKVIRVPLSE